MFVQTETTPNPNALKFIPGKIVSNSGQIEITKKNQINYTQLKNRDGPVRWDNYFLTNLAFFSV